jgi:hypothetical protein
MPCALRATMARERALENIIVLCEKSVRVTETLQYNQEELQQRVPIDALLSLLRIEEEEATMMQSGGLAVARVLRTLRTKRQD